MSKPSRAPGQVKIVKAERTWLGEHATYRGNQWYCKKTGKAILMVRASHTVWEDEGPGHCASDGQQTVFHLYCPACQKEPKFKLGSPITSGELMNASNG